MTLPSKFCSSAKILTCLCYSLCYSLCNLFTYVFLKLFMDFFWTSDIGLIFELYINPFMLIVPFKISICIYDPFDNKLGIKMYFTKKLKGSYL